MTEDGSTPPAPDFQALFEATPGLYLVLLSDPPEFTIVAVNKAYLHATMTEREQIVGKGLFTVFPDNPDELGATGVSNLRASLNSVLEQRAPHTMAIQKYDIRRPESEGGGFEERYWSPVNSPVLGADGAVIYIIHRAEDVTEFVRLEAQRNTETRLAQEQRSEAEQRLFDVLLRAEGLQESNSQLRQILTAREEAEAELRRANAWRDRVLESATLGIAVLDRNSKISLANPCFAGMLGYSVTELFETSFMSLLPPEDLPRVLELFNQTVQHGITVLDVETQLRHKNTSLITVSFGWSPLTSDSQSLGLVATLQDITERRRLENQLLQAQKLESIGRLAGGVAHDFNNLLTAILGSVELMEEDCTLDATAQEYLNNITQAADKAANLTRQLLAFARRQVIEPKTVNLNALVLSLNKMLRRLIGEHIEFVILLEEGLRAVKVDSGQFEQILVNLVVNARDAMPDGGKITIETHNVTLDEEYARHHEEVVPGDYVMLAVSDTGTGMEEGIRLHIFEPFFTTKEKGRGTGLGLATVYGIVRQAGGHIWLYSEPGEGTTFKIYLPCTTASLEAVAAPPSLAASVGGSETILIVEDEPSVRAVAVQILRRQGYTVLEAMNGEEALRLLKGREQEIALLVTDVVLPQMNGKELADRLQAIQPALKVLYASGYTENTVVHHEVLEHGVSFLSKPFTPALLARKVREILDDRRTPS